MIALHWTTRRCPAVEALAARPGEWTVFVSTPTTHTVAVRGVDGELHAPDADPWTLPAACFQLTAFDGTTELRWLADGDTGRAAWLSEDPAALPGGPGGEPIAADEAIADRSVLWGRPADGTGGGFSTWTDARVTAAGYPTRPGVARHDRACLDAVEYVAHDQHGNAHVVERRLLAITAVDLWPSR